MIIYDQILSELDKNSKAQNKWPQGLVLKAHRPI
jgi:hypothetical protein